jgi:thiamine monophosphate synthase
MYSIYVVLLVVVTEETFDVAHYAANTLVEFGVDLIVNDLVDLRVNHLIDHLTTGDGDMGLNRVQALVNHTIGSGINGCIRGEIASFLEDIRILVLIGHIRYPFCL